MYSLDLSWLLAEAPFIETMFGDFDIVADLDGLGRFATENTADKHSQFLISRKTIDNSIELYILETRIANKFVIKNEQRNRYPNCMMEI